MQFTFDRLNDKDISAMHVPNRTSAGNIVKVLVFLKKLTTLYNVPYAQQCLTV